MKTASLDISVLGSRKVMNIPLLEKNGLIAKISSRDHICLEDLLKSIEIDPGRAVMAEQVHGSKIAVVSGKDAGSGTVKPPIPSCDSLVTDEPGIALVVRTADCIPIFIFEPLKRVIGLVHAGRKGTAQKIAVKTLNLMADRFDILPSDCIIIAGPCIGKDCYEIDEKTVTDLKDCKGHIVKSDGKHWKFDLVGANLEQLKGAGVKEGNFYSAGRCTHCEADLFFSYRREGSSAGRNYSVLMIKE